MKLGVIADDFTGASDVASAIRQRGHAVALCMNSCAPDLPERFAATVVALKTRSIDATEAVRRSCLVQKQLSVWGATQFIFKICSTFDSTPMGNIGPVTEALAEALAIDGPVVVCPAFPDAHRTVYAGHLFVGDRLLSESGMEKHPLNPMTDPDIRRWLAQQLSGAVGYLPLAVVHAGEDAIRAHLAAEARAGRRVVIADAVENADLLALGRALRDSRLVVGASGIAMGLAAAHPADNRVERQAADAEGAGLVLAGSCSAATLAQVESYAARYPALAIDADSLMTGGLATTAALAFISSHLHDGPLVYSSAPPSTLLAVQQKYGVAKVAAALDDFFGTVARHSVAAGVRRLVVAGGETSGAVASALGLTSLEVGEDIAVGVPALRALDRPLSLALKSGNFGDRDFFARALAKMQADRREERA